MADMETLERCIEAIPNVMAFRKEHRDAIRSVQNRCIHCGMPLTDGECTRCFPAKTMPSRDMLIRQAILNWLNVHMPMCVKELGAVETLRRIESVWNDPLYFGRGVRQHFAALVDKYGEPKCHSF